MHKDSPIEPPEDSTTVRIKYNSFGHAHTNTNPGGSDRRIPASVWLWLWLADACLLAVVPAASAVYLLAVWTDGPAPIVAALGVGLLLFLASGLAENEQIEGRI